MLNFNSIATWLQNEAYTGNKPLAELQLQQTKARILLTIASLTYVILHGDYFTYYKVEALSFAALYFILNAAALISLRKRPFALIGSLFYPLLDVLIVTFGMLIDGGHSSGVYFMLLPIIIGNGLRFGNPMLIYAQASCLIGMLCSTAYGHYTLQLPIDYTLLYWQIFTLLAVPFYAYLIVKKVEKAIYEKNAAEQSSFQLIDRGPLPVFTFELDAKRAPQILYANEAMVQLFQNAQADILDQPADRLVLPEDSDEMIKFCRSAFRDEADGSVQQPSTTYLRGMDASGRIIKLMATAIRMRWQERWIGVCFLLDITERETLQEQMEAVHRQGYMSTLVAGIVHDFRNVLTNMIGNAEVVQMNCSDPVEKQQIESIIEAGERGSDLITHLLKLSRNSERNQSHNRTQGSALLQPLENIIGLARLQLPHNIRLVSRIEDELPDVEIEIIEIEQILLNLINNAMQAISDSGLIEVNIGSEDNQQADQKQLCITVSDNGEGISEENIDRVFKPFWTSRADQGGSGLGLTMVQRIVKLHQGKIDISSPAGEQQTTVRICIPSYMTENKVVIAQTVVTPPTVKQPEETTSQRILLVDDMPDILKVHNAIVTRLGHDAEAVESVDSALTLFTDPSSHFDLIITDFRMPGKDGLELVQEIRKRDPKIPILMVTAFGEDEQLQQAGSYGVTLMNKPITIERMKAGIAKAVAGELT
ncbi:response regulator [Mariprofundus sp. NF]|uniref:hybrid sensor histidine kinase/response regulator n=1 Tax=Mariprofundus sp. NF TaxID=2608716 RepID=UPI0015A4B918|nr:PAS domain-containing hybrid sensor histidine kinase/response regulator [Mariprofundus sp. NF]NWF39256.1 response regulator [Mariprofundus sp. NF]